LEEIRSTKGNVEDPIASDAGLGEQKGGSLKTSVLISKKGVAKGGYGRRRRSLVDIHSLSGNF